MPEAVRVWAPEASRVEVVVVGNAPIPAALEAGGWWHGPTVREGDDYLICVDGAPPRPDPRSRWQPAGIHGPSRWIDPAAMRHPTAPAPVPLREAVIYELHVGTFTADGTFASAIARLDHLVRLGVTHVELMPVAQFPGVHGWGYDGVDLFAAHEPYGGPAGLHELIRACHQRGLAVLVDAVLNHFGPEGAYANGFGPYTTKRFATPWGEAVNLESREVRRFLLDSALAWLRDYGADGLRLDALHALHDPTDRHLVAELVDEVGDAHVLIGEYDDHDPAAVSDRERGGWGLDAHWNDDFHHAIHALVTGEHTGYYADFAAPGTLAKILERGYALDGGYSAFREAHHGQPYGDLPRDRLIGYVQSHDQVGNRLAGERLHHLCGLPRAKIAAAILFASPFVPMLFQGEEWAASTPFHYFADLESREMRAALEEGRRREHGHSGAAIDPLDHATRDASVLRWDELDAAPHAEMLDWYRALIALRRDAPALRDPSPTATRVTQSPAVIAIERGGHVLTCNLGDEPERADLGDVVLASTDLADSHALPPRSCAFGRR
jgi:maltooligosyltrehalose trehalohydrolase